LSIAIQDSENAAGGAAGDLRELQDDEVITTLPLFAQKPAYAATATTGFQPRHIRSQSSLSKRASATGRASSDMQKAVYSAGVLPDNVYPDPFAPIPSGEPAELADPLSLSSMARGGAIATYGLPNTASHLIQPTSARSARSQSSLDEKASGYSTVDIGRNDSLRDIKAAALGAVNKARSVGVLGATGPKRGWGKNRLFGLAGLVGLIVLVAVGVGTGVGVSMAKKHSASANSAASINNGAGADAGGQGVQSGSGQPAAPAPTTSPPRNEGFQNLVVFGSGLNGGSYRIRCQQNCFVTFIFSMQITEEQERMRRAQAFLGIRTSVDAGQTVCTNAFFQGMSLDLTVSTINQGPVWAEQILSLIGPLNNGVRGNATLFDYSYGTASISNVSPSFEVVSSQIVNRRIRRL
jgi:hypothetical protein